MYNEVESNNAHDRTLSEIQIIMKTAMTYKTVAGLKSDFSTN